MFILDYPSDEAAQRIDDITRRGLSFNPEDVNAVSAMLDAVRARGDAALIEYTAKFDARI